MTTADEEHVGAYRAAAARLPGGVCVVTVAWRGSVHATTVSSVASVSLRPPQLLFCVHADSRLADALEETARWTLSVLADGQAPVADWLASYGRPVVDQLLRVPHTVSALTGGARLDGAAAWFDCETVAAYESGDHRIVVGSVLDAVQGDAEVGSLVHLRGRLRPVR